MKKTLNIAMIGYQFMGRAHANAWRQAAHFFQLPAKPVLKVICGRNAQAVKVAAEQLGFEESATDWKAVIDRDDIDIVDICTPGDSHCEIAIYAAQRGKAVLCEKPLANTIDEAQQMVTAAQDAGVTNMLCHNYRRVPAVQLAKQMIDNGELGTLHHYRGTYLQDWLVNPNVPRSWRLEKAKAGSGALGDIVSHNLDLARFLVGDISEVSGLMKTFVQERPLEDGSGMGRVDVDDAAMALLKFANGAIGSVEGSRFATGRKNSNSFEINGSKGSLVFDLERLNELQFYQEQGPDSGFRTIHVTNPEHPYTANWWPPGHSIGYEHSFVHTVVDFVQAVANGQSVSPDFADGLAIQKMLKALETSSEKGQWQTP